MKKKMNKYIQSGKDNPAPEYYDLMLRKKLKKDKSLSKLDNRRDSYWTEVGDKFLEKNS